MGDINAIVAIGKNGEIGMQGKLIWKISDDLKHFKALTMGHPVIMGRKTWESLPKRPLPGRRNIVLSRRKDYNPEGAEPVSSVEEALNITAGENPFIIGGAEIYNAFMPHINVWHLTKVDDIPQEADAFLYLDLKDWTLQNQSPMMSTPDGLNFNYLTFKK